MRIVRLALAVLLFAACSSPEPQPAPEVRPSATPTPNLLDGVAVYPLGDLHSDVALVLRARPGYSSGSQASTGEIWAVPLDGSPPRLLIRYAGAPVEGPGGFTSLRRQLSADGRRLVLSVSFPQPQPFVFANRLVMIDLVTTDARLIPTQTSTTSPFNYVYDQRPALSPDGGLIAFDRFESSFWTGIWTVRADGTELRQLCRAGIAADARNIGYFYGCYAITGWAPDGRLGFAEVDGLSFAETSGAIERLGYHLSSVMGVDHRTTEPSVVATTSTGIVTSDEHGRGQRVLVGPGSFPQEFEPRWRPGRDDILVREGVAPNSKLVVLTPTGPIELATGMPRSDGRCPARAEWNADGSKIVYLSDCVTDPFVLRTIDVGDRVTQAGADRLLAQLPDGRAGWRPVDLAVVRYP